jgi:protein-S-isoprenylcysteine O-methyltransferase Ste14
MRNPIYLAGITLLAGVGLLYGPWRVIDLAMPVALFVYFHLAVILFEEPALRRQFGAGYGAYCQRVSRWLPRLALGGPPKRRS